MFTKESYQLVENDPFNELEVRDGLKIKGQPGALLMLIP